MSTAASFAQVLDVTCRYTRRWDECVARRTKCPELWLARVLAAMQAQREAALPAPRRAVLAARRAREAEELRPQNYVPPPLVLSGHAASLTPY